MACLKPEQGGTFADLTFGEVGIVILEASEESTLLAMDCDPDAKERSIDLEKEFGDRFSFFDSSFKDLIRYLLPQNLMGY